MAQTNYRSPAAVSPTAACQVTPCATSTSPAQLTRQNLTKAFASVSTAADKASSWLRRAFDDELAIKTEGPDRAFSDHDGQNCRGAGLWPAQKGTKGQ